MLGLFLKLGPIAAGLLGSVGSIAVVSAGFWLWNTFVDNPTIIRIERATIEAQIKLAVSEGRRLEQERQIRIADAAMQHAAEDEAALQAAHEESISKLTEEAKRYAAERLAEGRACPITPGDLDFLLRD